jgi:hypothetical protein
MQKFFWVPLFMLIWLAVTVFASQVGIQYNWPDNVHVDYGVPLTWATHTLSTISGPANLWAVNLTNLLIDIVFWLGLMIIGVTLIVWKIKA